MDLKQTFISQLSEATGISADDLILISQFETGATGTEIVSKKLPYNLISASLVSDLDEKVEQLVEDGYKDLSNDVINNKNQISALSSKHDTCESAVVKVANCINQTKADIELLSNTIHLDEISCLNRDNFLCTAINSTSSYLSTSINYISSNTRSNFTETTSKINFLSGRHDWLSSQLSDAITTKVYNLSVSLSNHLSSRLKDISESITELNSDLESANDEIADLKITIDEIEIPDVASLIGSLNSDMYDEGGRIDFLSSQIQYESNGMHLISAFNSMDEAQERISTMKNGDVIVIGPREYYLSGGNFYLLGNENLESHEISAISWNSATDIVLANSFKIQNSEPNIVISKSELDTSDREDCVYFCIDE